MSIRTRLWLSITALIGLVLAGNGLVVLRAETRELRESFARESRTFLRLAAPQALRAYGESVQPDGLDRVDPRVRARIETICRGLPSLRAFGLRIPRGRLLLVHPEGATLPPVEGEALDSDSPKGWQRYLDGEGGEQLLELVMPVHGRAGSPPVVAQLLVSDQPVRERLSRLRKVYAGSLLLLLALGAWLASRLARMMLGPVEALKGVALRIRDGDLSARAPDAPRSEIGDLARAFNDMAREVEQHRAELEERNEALERAYEDLQAMQQELVDLERMAAVGRTASAVSHEIDNPIGVILGTAQMLRQELADEPEMAEDVALIEAECKRCRRIVRDLLDFARPSHREAGPLDLPRLVDTVLRGLTHHPAFKQVSFETRWREPLPAVIAEADGLKQVLLNLFLNAARSMNGSGLVEVEGTAEGARVSVEVRDQGAGIAEENLGRIFEPFFTTSGGSGLGLPVSRRIVEEQGGTLRAANRPEGGSVFLLELVADREGEE